MTFIDPHYLLHDQYRDASNLNARMALHARFSTNTYGWHRWVFDRLQVPFQGRLLEVGCGPGRLWLENRDRIPPDWRITLTDFSPGMIAEAQVSLKEIPASFAFEVMDVQSLAFADAGFDVVIANHMLYHVPDREKAFAEIRRVLRLEGRFYAATNGRDHMRELRELEQRFGIDSRLTIPAQSFRLEGGREELLRWFPSVQEHRYESGLEVTEAEPLLAFILSGSARSLLSEEKIRELEAYIEREIALKGSLYITKSTGMFEAWREEPHDSLK
jgi:ubiquinone/menaquinone biosynthesis C-methylase UbiE